MKRRMDQSIQEVGKKGGGSFSTLYTPWVEKQMRDMGTMKTQGRHETYSSRKKSEWD